MSRAPLPAWAEEMAADNTRYAYVGGVDDHDIWARQAPNHSANDWDVYTVNVSNGTCWGMDVFMSTDLATNLTQKGSIERMQEHLGEDGFKRMALLLRCFAPYLFKGKLWPEFHVKNLRDTPNEKEKDPIHV